MKNTHNDMPDSEKDEKKLQSDKATLNLPDVEDIPGQENVRPPSLKMYKDTTASSADEEGEAILNTGNSDADISKDELQTLNEPLYNSGAEEENDLKKASPDNTDDEGDLLNEESFEDDRSGDDLDVPGAEEDDADEDIGEEDEENNYYSPGDNQ